MPVDARDVIARLSPERQARIKAEAERIIEEIGQANLRELRQMAERRQDDVAAAMNVSQPAVANLERRADALLSTLDQYVRALGGRLRVLIELPGRAPVELDMSALRPNEDGSAI